MPCFLGEKLVTKNTTENGVIKDNISLGRYNFLDVIFSYKRTS